MKRAQLERLAAAKTEAKLFNDRCPVGAEVRYWPDVMIGPGRASFTRSPAFVGCGNRPVVFLAGRSGSVVLSRVMPVLPSPSPAPVPPAA